MLRCDSVHGWLEMLKTQLAGESDVAHQEELQCEIRELEGLIPDVESKVFIVEPLNNIRTFVGRLLSLRGFLSQNYYLKKSYFGGTKASCNYTIYIVRLYKESTVSVVHSPSLLLGFQC